MTMPYTNTLAQRIRHDTLLKYCVCSEVLSMGSECVGGQCTVLLYVCMGSAMSIGSEYGQWVWAVSVGSVLCLFVGCWVLYCLFILYTKCVVVLLYTHSRTVHTLHTAHCTLHKHITHSAHAAHYTHSLHTVHTVVRTHEPYQCTPIHTRIHTQQ